ncbi:DDE superfamily endonuclease [Nitrosomonas sp. Nm34]|nr:DDE superfamily endonuclease [Nitrosomonas sp. Nm34]
MPDNSTQTYVYAYAAVSAADGELDILILPQVNNHCIQIFLNEVASRHRNDRIILALDEAGWHCSHSLKLPHNLRLLMPPPYSPEFNPAKNLWDQPREKSFHNRVFDSLDALENHLEVAMRDMEKDRECVYSLVA